MQNNTELDILRHSAAHLMARAVMRLFPNVQLAFGIFLTCLCAGCAAKSDVDADVAVTEIAALVPAPLPKSAEITELFERAERFLHSNENVTSFQAIHAECLRMLVQAKARYGDTESYADLFKQRLKELDTTKLPPELRNDPHMAEALPQMKERALMMTLLEMSQTGLAVEAIRKAAANPSLCIRALVPYIRGELQFRAEQYEEAGKSFKQAMSEATIAPTSGNNFIISEIMYLIAGNDAMLDVVLYVEECLPEKKTYAFEIAKAWCKVHKDDLAAGNFEPFLQRAEEGTPFVQASVYVRAVIKEQMKQGKFDDVSKTIDLIFLPDEGNKNGLPANTALTRSPWHNLCLEAWILGCIQHGKLAEAQTVADSIETDNIVSKMIILLVGGDIAQDVLGKAKWMPLNIHISDNAIDKDISVPKYSDTELLEFCRWYAAKAENKHLRYQTCTGLFLLPT